jgi:hypothetical protein
MIKKNTVLGYNEFCKELKAGQILYNLNAMNLWGDYLLVANVIHTRVGNADSYTVLLIGLDKKDNGYIPRNLYISLTPDNVEQIPFLKPVGYCKFKLVPIIENLHINAGLAAIYSQTDLRKFVSKLSVRKPRTRRYDRDGNPIIKKQ